MSARDRLNKLLNFLKVTTVISNYQAIRREQLWNFSNDCKAMLDLYKVHLKYRKIRRDCSNTLPSKFSRCFLIEVPVQVYSYVQLIHRAAVFLKSD